MIMTEEEKKKLNSILNAISDIHSGLMDRRSDINELETRLAMELSRFEDYISESE